MIEIGPMLASLRVLAGLSQVELADRATRFQASGVVLTRNEVSRWERGTRLPTNYWLVPLAEVFGVPLAQLQEARAHTRRTGRRVRRPACWACGAPAIARFNRGLWMCKRHKLLHLERARRGEVWIAAGGVYARKPRPVVVVQGDDYGSADSLTVCPTTSQEGGTTLTRVPVEPSRESGLLRPSFVMVDKVTTLDRRKAPVRLGVLPAGQMGQVDNGLRRFLGIGG